MSLPSSETCYPASGNDNFYLSSGDDWAYGYSGSDNFVASDDILAGISGNDILIGGLGSDQLTGGAGNDLFSFKSINESLPSSFDYILDFSAGDKIDLKGIDANTALAGDQAFSFQSAATRNAVWWNTDALNGDVNGDAIADFAVHVSLVGLTEFRSANVIL